MLQTSDLISFESDERLKELSLNLSCSTTTFEKYSNNSIMDYGSLCNHDDGYLCEHRLQFIIDFIKTEFLS